MSSAVEQPLTRACDWLGPAAGGLTLPIRDLRLDSREVEAGDAFIALAGEHSDGRDHVAEAVARGATLVVIDSAAPGPALKTGDMPVADVPVGGVPVIALGELRGRLGDLAHRFYASRGEPLQVIGVTGTNGKTSVSFLLAQLLEAADLPCAVIGTLGWGLLGEYQGTGMTTPDVVSVHRILHRLGVSGARYVAMEVSSHGLQQGRVDGVDFSAAVFTNLSRDHLDYHGDMASYGASKRRLFTRDLQFGVFNLDDEFGLSLYLDSSLRGERLGYSLANSVADIHCSDVQYDNQGARAELHTPWGNGTLRTGLLGPYNLQNLIAGIAVLGALGVDLDLLLAGAPACTGAPGRMERVHDDEVKVIVDYAHTPDALEQLLLALKPHTGGALWVVFGCGGNRDKGKRAQMGAVAEGIADNVILTSDNPRDELPLAIIEDIRSGMSGQSLRRVEPDRALAIAAALDEASPGDTVVIAGKGHEDYQQIGEQRHPFNDRVCVQRYYASRRAAL